jgi:DNA-binding NarL/FixJ family response regulator
MTHRTFGDRPSLVRVAAEIGRARYSIRPSTPPTIRPMARDNGKARRAAGGGSGQHDGGEPITVVIADDHRSFGEALEIALGKERDLDIVRVVADGEDAVRAAVERQPDVVLMDLQMPGIDGIEATRRLREEGSTTAVIVMSGDPDDVTLARAVQAGARGFVPKTEAVEGLVNAIRRAHRGEPLHDAAEVHDSLERLRARTQIDGDLARRVQRLTPRELEILQALADGGAPDSIADQLGMSRHTLRTHTQNILTKLGVHSKVEAIIVAIRFGKVRTPGVIRLPESEAITSVPPSEDLERT